MKDLRDDSTIFSMSSHLSKEQLVQYHLGHLMKEELHTVEKHLVDCELCKDALSGLALMPDYKGIDRIRKDIRKIARPRTGMMDQIAWRNVIITASVLSLVTLATLFYIYFSGTTKKPDSKKPETPYKKSQPAKPVVPRDSSYSAPSKSEEKQVAEAADSIPSSTPKHSEVYSSDYKVVKIEPIKPRHTNAVAENFIRHENIKLHPYNLPTHFILELKAVDYSGIYSSSPDAMGKFETGVQAQYKDTSEQTYHLNEIARETHQVTYENFLEDALNNYKIGNFDDAIDEFNLIQKYFPKDLNALFYSGLCYYQLGRWNLAWARFSVSLDDNKNPFYEESKWYKALTEIKQNKLAEAKQLLNEIVNEDGFYKKDAEKKLVDLK